MTSKEREDQKAKVTTEEELIGRYKITDYTKRVVKEVKPPKGIPSDEEFYEAELEDGLRVPNTVFLREHFYHEGRLSEDQTIFLLQRVTEIFRKESNVLRLYGPVTICGDIHGQYFDMVHWMMPKYGGNPLKVNYLFLGDYVDRGYFSVEVLLWLFSLKIIRPEGINMLRGNHESKHLTNYFTFRIECTRKYSERIYEAFVEVFKTMPLAAVVDDKFFCVHGGIGPESRTLDEIEKINRFVEIPNKGPMCDLLWSDPAPPGSELLPNNPLFLPNPIRGCACYYTYEAVCQFLEENNLISIIRGHEAQFEGYNMLKRTKAGYPSVITVFSAPNYCDAYSNEGAIATWNGTQLYFKMFKASPHPFCLPNMADAFSWSLPYVAEKALDMLQVILDTIKEDKEKEETPSPGLVMSHVYRLLRQTGPEGALEFRSLPVNISDNLDSAADAAATEMPTFEQARTCDIQNERLPPVLLPAGEAKQFFSGKGIYSLKQSATQLARKISVGTTSSSSPSTRKRDAELSMALIRSAAELMEKDEKHVHFGKDLQRKGSKKVSGRIRGRIKAREDQLEEELGPQEDEGQQDIDETIDQEQEEKQEATREINLKGVIKTIEKLKALNATAPSAKIIADTIQYSHELE
ncbi:Metallo-dependent phosphatase [Serendipita vermifera]|nr:Metallo-dependent phosphatase [Serendipita vermifera]